MGKNKDIQKREIPFSANLQLRASEESGENVIEGVAIVFNTPSVPLYEDGDTVIREVIAPDAVPVSLLDSSDILLTLYHDNNRLLARSCNGEGSLKYTRSEDGVHFSFTPADTPDGQTALEHVKRGDINGCSFAFTIDPDDSGAVEREVKTVNGKREITYTVKRILGIYDFTLTPRPAYQDTSVGAKLRDEEMMRAETLALETANIKRDAAALRARAGKY